MTAFLLRIFLPLFTSLLLTQAASADLQLSADERALVDGDQIIEVAVMYDFVPFSYVEGGVHTGFVADLLALLETRTGARLKARVGEWSDNLERLRNKQIDAIADMSFKPERTSFALYTTPYFEIPTVVFTDKSFGEYHSLADLSGKQVGVLRNIFYAKELSAHQDIHLRPYDDYKQLTHALAFGKIDAAIQNLTSGYHYATHNAYTNIKMAGEFTLDTVGREDLRFGVRTDRPAIQSLLQKGLDSITPEEWDNLINRWVGVSAIDFTDQRRTVALTSEEREFVKNNPVIRVHNEYNFEPYSFFENGQPQGHSVDFIRLLAQRAGLEVEFVSGHSWNDYLNMMRNGQLDVMTNIVFSHDRANYMLFTTPYLRLAQGVYQRQGAPAISSIEALQVSTLALPEGFYTYERLKQLGGFNVQPAEDSLEALMLVSTGAADATIEIMGVAEHLLQKYAVPGVTGSMPHQLLAAEPLTLRLGIAVNKPLLHRILQKAMDSLSEHEKRQLQNKWNEAHAREGHYIHLTGKELAWLESRAAVRICSVRQRLPYEQLTSQNHHIGVFADLLEVMRHNAGLSVKLIPVEHFREGLQKLKQNECDLVSRAPAQFTDTGVSLSQPLLEGSLVIATGLDEIYVRNFSQLVTHTLAVVEGSHVHAYLNQYHPELHIRLYPDVDHALDAVADGRAFGLVGTLPVLSRALVTQYRANIKISGELVPDYPVVLATRSNDQMLLQIVNKAIQSIGTEQFETIGNRWLQAPILAEPPDYRLIIQATLATLLLITLILVWNRKLARLNTHIQDSQNQLMIAHEELKQKNRMLEQLSTTDRLTRLKNRLYLEQAFELHLKRAEQVQEYGFCLLLIDIDHFKDVNDRHGHECGDAVLADFAAILSGNSRNQDILARWGGEEFMMICPDISLEVAVQHAQKLLSAIRDHHFHRVGQCTASIGVAVWGPGDCYKTLSRRADQALYQAKRQGRDQVCHSHAHPCLNETAADRV